MGEPAILSLGASGLRDAHAFSPAVKKKSNVKDEASSLGKKVAANDLLSGFEEGGSVSEETILSQAKKMLLDMGVFPDEGELSLSGELVGLKTKLIIKDKQGVVISEVPYATVLERYKLKEHQAGEVRNEQTAELEYQLARCEGKTLQQARMKLQDKLESPFETDIQIRIWKDSGKRSHDIESTTIGEILANYQGIKIGFNQEIRNLTKVYGSKAKAIEKYISQTAVGRSAEQAFSQRSEKLAMQQKKVDSLKQKADFLEQKIEKLSAISPKDKKLVWQKLQLGLASINEKVSRVRNGISTPLSYAGAISKAVSGLMLYDANPMRLINKAVGNPIEKLWTQEWGKTEVSFRELAARLEEKLIVDPITGEGVRTGAITGDKIREASLAGAAWGVRMNLLPQMLAQLPVLKALNLNPGEIYSMMRSTNMLKSGSGSIKKFVKMWKEKETAGEKAKVASWVLGSGIGFYIAEKLAPNIGGAINPVLMGDIWLMRLVGQVQKYTGENRLEGTELTNKFEMVEHGITAAFAADSANGLGSRLWTYVETGAIDPRSSIKDEESLLDMVEEHPEYLQGEGGGPFGKLQRMEHEFLLKVKGVELGEESSLQNYTLVDDDGKKAIYYVDPGDEERQAVVIKQEDEGVVSEWINDKWVKVETETDKVVETVEVNKVANDEDDDSNSSESERVEVAQVVHDYVYFEPGTNMMVFRMDLAEGDTWDSKVERLFKGYQEGGIDDSAWEEIPTGEEVKALEEGSDELRALSGDDGVYERQIYDSLIRRLLEDASENGLNYDLDEVQARMIQFLLADTTSDADTMEGELDYAQLYQYLFFGSELDSDKGEEPNPNDKDYFLSGNEVSGQGAEIRLTIPSGGTFSSELGKSGYGMGNYQFFDAKSELVENVQVYRVLENGTEELVENLEELGLVHPEDQFVVRLGGVEEFIRQQEEMPTVTSLYDEKWSSWELPYTERDQLVLEEEWRKEAVRDESGEIFVGEVPTNGDFTHLFSGKLGHLLSVYDFFTVWQEELVAGGRIEVYKEHQLADGTWERQVFSEYSDMNVLAPGDKVIIVDKDNLLSEIHDQELLGRADTPLEQDPTNQENDSSDDTTPEQSDPGASADERLIEGITEEGLLDTNNLPNELVRDKEGNIYIGEIEQGVYLSTLIASKLGETETDPWKRVYSSYLEDKINILRVTKSGELEVIENLDQVGVGEKIVIQDPDGLLGNIQNYPGYQSDQAGSLPDSVEPDVVGPSRVEAEKQGEELWGIEPGVNLSDTFDIDNLPTEVVRNPEGYIYVGEIEDEMWLSQLIDEKLSGTEGGSWQKVATELTRGNIEIYKLDSDGNLVLLADPGLVSPGDKIVIRDQQDVLDAVQDYVAPYVRVVETEVHSETSIMNVEAVRSEILKVIEQDGSTVRMTVIDPDNPENIIDVGGEERFNAASVPKVAIAMLIIKEIEEGRLEIDDKSKYTVLPGDYVPTIEQLLSLMLTYSDNDATSSLVRELTGGEDNMELADESVSLMLKEEMGLSSTSIGEYTTTSDMAKVFNTLFRTTYVSPDHRELIVSFLNSANMVNLDRDTSLMEENLSIYSELDVVEKVGLGTGDRGEYDSPAYNTISFIQGTDGRDLIISLSVNAADRPTAISSMRSISRAIAEGAYDLDANSDGLEIDGDVANYIEREERAKRDYIDHVLYPYQQIDGTMAINPALQIYIDDWSEINWSTFEKEAVVYRDGSSVIHLSQQLSDRVITIFIDNNQEISHAIDNQKLGMDYSYEVYSGSHELDSYSSGEFNPDSENLTIDVSTVDAGHYDTSLLNGRYLFINSQKKQGAGFDYYIFNGDSSDTPVIAYARDGSRRDLGSIPSNVRVAIVDGDGGDEALSYLIENLSLNKTVEEVVIHRNGMVETYESDSIYSSFGMSPRDVEIDDKRNETEILVNQEEWENWTSKDDNEKLSLIWESLSERQIREIEKEYYRQEQFFQVMRDVYGGAYYIATLDQYREEMSKQLWSNYESEERLIIDEDTIRNSLGLAENLEVVDGVKYFKSIYIPNDYRVDKAVLARSFGIDIEDIVLQSTNDPSVFLLGERVSEQELGEGAVRASFTYGADKLLYQYEDGSLTAEYIADNENPLVAVYPLERPLSSYLTAEKLVPLPEEIEVKLQYLERPYYVEQDEGDKVSVFVDPVSMDTYAKVDSTSYSTAVLEEGVYPMNMVVNDDTTSGFYPVVRDGYSFREMAEIYGDGGMSSSEIWERRVEDSIARTVSQSGISLELVGDKLIVNQPEKLGGERTLDLWLSSDGQVQVSSEGRLLLVGESGFKYEYKDGNLEIYEIENDKSLNEYLEGFSVLISDGESLQYRGFPLLVKDELIYIISHEGVQLVGTQQELSMPSLVKDQDVTEITNQIWGIEETKELSEPLGFTEIEAENSKMVHGLAVSHERLLEVSNGVVDIETGDRYLVADDDKVMVEASTGKLVMQKESDGKEYFYNNNGWEQVDNTQVIEDYLSEHDLSRLSDIDPTIAEAWNLLIKRDPNITVRELVDRRTELPVFSDGEMVYVIDGTGLRRIGEKEAMLAGGFVGYLDEVGEYQTMVPDSLWTHFLRGYRYQFSERIGYLVDPWLNSQVKQNSEWVSDYQVKDVFSSLKDQDRVDYDELPPEYVQALLSQEQKRLFRYDENEAFNINLTVVVQMILSGGKRGGSTLTQGFVKNMLMSFEERSGRSVGRKVTEILMADKILEEISVEKVVEMYANSVSYGSSDGQPILGTERAAEVMFGKNLSELTLTEIGMLIVVPNHPARTNLNNFENASSWADAASGVYYHMWQNGFITDRELEVEYQSIHEEIMPSGTQAEIDSLIEADLMKESDLEWIKESMEAYQALDFEGRKIIETTTENEVLKADTVVKSLFPTRSPLDVRDVFIPSFEKETITTTTYEYADFYQFLSITRPDKFSQANLEAAYEQYYWVGKMPVHDLYGESMETVQENFSWASQLNYNPNQNHGEIGVGETFTTRGFDPENPDYTPRVIIDPFTGEIKIDSWSHRYEAMQTSEKLVENEEGLEEMIEEPIIFNVLGEGKEGKPIIQGKDGSMWKVTENGLERLPGKIYQVEDGGAVQGELMSGRPGMIVVADGMNGGEGRYIQDSLGYYYQLNDDGSVKYIGRGMENKDGMTVLYESPMATEAIKTDDPKKIPLVSIENLYKIVMGKEVPPNLDYTLNYNLPLSKDPNIGFRLSGEDGELGSMNPEALTQIMEDHNQVATPVEIARGHGGDLAFESMLTTMISDGKPVLVWMNSDLGGEVENVSVSGEETRYESISRTEKPVVVLSVFESDGQKYVAYQDPSFEQPFLIRWENFAKSAAPTIGGRYKAVVFDEYTVPSEYKRYVYDIDDPSHQVELQLGDGYVYNHENPGEIEGLMTINAGMQEFVTEEAAKIIDSEDTGGVIAIAMDESGSIPFFVALDDEGKPADPKMAFSTYQPGSIYKLVTSMWALENGVRADNMMMAGNYYEWQDGLRTHNWNVDSETGVLRSSSASSEMRMNQAIAQSNNPYFLNLAMREGSPQGLSDYGNLVGFGEGDDYIPGLPTQESIIPSSDNPSFSSTDYAFTAIGQGPMRVSPTEMLRFIGALSNDGLFIEPSIMRQSPEFPDQLMPNDKRDFSDVRRGMERVTSHPTGTAYSIFHDVRGYTVFGKTGTAENGGGVDPHAWFVGWAVDDKTGDKLSFVFMFPYGGEGSNVAAPIVREVLDKYFGNINAYHAHETSSIEQVVDQLPTEEGSGENEVVSSSPPIALATPEIERVEEIEMDVVGFRLESQPNSRLLSFVADATEIANEFEPSRSDTDKYQEGKEFVEYLEQELVKRGYQDVTSSKDMQGAFTHLQDNYLMEIKYDNDELKEPVQCVGWQGFIGETESILGDGVPVSIIGIPGDAAAAAIRFIEARDGSRDYDIGGRVVHFDDEKSDITLLEPGDAFFLRYPPIDGLGHTGNVLATGTNVLGEPTVLISDSNRMVDKYGVLITDGKPRLRWMTQAEFTRQYERETDIPKNLGPSRFVVVRPDKDEDERIESVFDINYVPRAREASTEDGSQEEDQQGTEVNRAIPDEALEFPEETLGSSDEASSEWNRIVDKANPLTKEEIEEEIEPFLEKLDEVSQPIAEIITGGNIIELQSHSIDNLEKLIVDSQKDGVELYISSGYRGYEDQEDLFEELGPEVAAVPGTSQHHTGLAVDFTTPEIGFVADMNAGFENTEAGIWLRENGWKYGWVQSYTENHDGIDNETWHYYYLGLELAEEWHNSQGTDDPKDMFEILELVTESRSEDSDFH